MKIFATACLFAFSASLAIAQSAANWNYTGANGPDLWSRLDPSYAACNKGHQQSPIDIHGTHLNPALQPVEYHYISGGLRLENTGHAMQGIVHPGSYILVDGVRYDLLRFEFHHPAEHPVKGKLADMDVQLVHKSAEGKYVIVAVRFLQDTSVPNALMALLWPHLPTAAGKSEEVTDRINPGGFLPADRSYWTYTGSLTAPPCTEGVRWFVYQQEVSISRAQFKTFAQLYRVSSRPTQDAHGRRIETHQ